MHSEIRTRFAPSPTGYLHVGGARTALFNWLFARKHGGKFLLRIEDTDRERSSEAMTHQIFEGLAWLGLHWDEEVIYQGSRAHLHRDVARQLIRLGKAYPCFCSKEELEEKRRLAQKERRAYRYDGTCRRLSARQVQENMEQGLPYAIRFKVPAGETAWDDAVHGTIRVQHAELDDFIILRSDGSPVYHLAVVVDDHMMGITHVIRGDDHISNSPKQILLYQALKWAVPTFAHVPLILGPDRKRLSKRHGATSVEEYRQQGILPEALFNYLALLGWSPGDNRELMSRKEIIEAFSLEGISKNNAVFDEAKLVWMNSQYISRSSDTYLWSRVSDLLVERGIMNQKEVIERKPYLLDVIGLLKTRVKRLTDFVDQALYFYRDPEVYEEKGLRKHVKREEIWTYLAEATDRLAQLENFSEEAIEQVIRQLAEEKGLSAAKLIHPIRLALTGVSVSPGLFELMSVLGKQTVVRRLKRFVEQKEQLMQTLASGATEQSS